MPPTSASRFPTVAPGADRIAATLPFFQPVPPWLWTVTFAAAGWGLFTLNGSLTVASAFTLPLLASLLWFRGQPPVLLASCAMQWLQVVTPVLYANYQGAPMSAYGLAEMERATWLSLCGLMALALGIRLALWRAPLGGTDLEEEARQLSPPRLFQAWLCSWVIAYLAVAVGWYFGGLAQAFHALAGLKWLFFFFMAYAAFVRQDGYGLLFVAVTIEFIAGILGFFAGFKEVFFMLLLAAATTRLTLSLVSRLLLTAAVIFVIGASLLWSTVKMEYRSFLNQDSGQQVVSVPVAARLAKLEQLISNMTAEDLSDGLDALVQRTAYTEYFAHALAYVPASVPYERGQLWWGAVTHVVKPRFLFPGKASLNDSERTAIYTGLAVAGSADTESGTSIGLGYMAESYIDFGPVGMFVPIFLFGLFMGSIYRFFTLSNASPLLGIALATAALFPVLQAFEVSNIKLLGGTVTRCLLIFVVGRLLAVTVMNWLRRFGDRSRRASPQVAPGGR